ncbi:hypothetical protein AVEN_224677-1 [Araneus ventricosus]|uniref:Uncharacterized protein n=1 Tax=Araneus ventricosus TaxID=182803 RepID=A0A4Y2LPK6_ARAVE|nr:hypothetical protein AVEN_224677-1 [Araneus ventricosus]
MEVVMVFNVIITKASRHSNHVRSTFLFTTQNYSHLLPVLTPVGWPMGSSKPPIFYPYVSHAQYISRYVSRTTGGRDLILGWSMGSSKPLPILAIRLRMRRWGYIRLRMQSTFLAITREPLGVET